MHGMENSRDLSGRAALSSPLPRASAFGLTSPGLDLPARWAGWPLAAHFAGLGLTEDIPELRSEKSP